MRRPGPWTAVSVGLVASLVLALLVGSSMLPATGRPTKPEANRFAPSGVVGVDPDAAATAGAATARAQAATAAAPGGGSVPGPSVSGTSGCNDVDGTNVRVNQECTNQSDAAFLGRGQGQNETAVAVNPKNPRHLLVGQNDYRRGDGACGADWSYDGGRRWGSELAPLSFTAPGFTQARHYWDASGDPSVAFDSSGEAYLFCLAFNRAPPASDVNSAASAAGPVPLGQRRGVPPRPTSRSSAASRSRPTRTATSAPTTTSRWSTPPGRSTPRRARCCWARSAWPRSGPASRCRTARTTPATRSWSTTSRPTAGS